MKKQIFLIVMLAFFAVVVTDTASGQALHNTAANTVSCVSTPLSPIAGNLVTYSATGTPPGGNFQWWATTKQSFIAAGVNNIGTKLTVPDSLLAASASYGNTTTTNNVDITWSTAALNRAKTVPTFVVVQYDAPVTGCANNLEVIKITPTNAFTLDITSMAVDGSSSAGYGIDVAQCYAITASAIYDAGADKVTMDYGINTMYFEVVAANFTGDFNPNLQLSGLNALQTAVVTWGYSIATATTALTLGTPFTATTNLPDTHLGVSFYVKVVISNHGWEGLNPDIITLSVDGTNSVGDPDVDASCAENTPFADVATQTLSVRPTVITTPASLGKN